MKKIISLLLLVMGGTIAVFGQEKFTISGYIEDAKSGEKLIEANVFDHKKLLGTVSNLYGFYSITLPKDSVKISFSYIGYETQTFEIYLDKNVTLDIKLSDETTLSAVVVTAESATEKIEEQTQMSRIDVPIKQIKRIPPLLGEVDVLKALQLLPGIQSGGEGTSGLYVRGGSPDQNLMLLDGVPVYNANHLFGFFSVFNADAIHNVSLIKGGFPARYGGRLSSVLDITMKEGNDKKFHAEGAVGIIAAKLSVEGPIKKDKTSFIVSGRRTYLDILTQPLIKKENNGEPIGYYFYDLNAKINHKFNKKHRLYLSSYLGKDVFYATVVDNGFKMKSGVDWGNVTTALRWNYMITPQLFANTTATYSRYRFNLDNNVTETEGSETQSTRALYSSDIEDFAAKIDLDYMPNPNHFIRFGVNTTFHQFNPGAFQYNVKSENMSIDTTLGRQNTSSIEYFAYVEDDMKIGENFSANIGFHFSGTRVEKKNYISPQARLGIRYLLPKGLALKGSYAMMTQYIHLLTNEGAGLPTDLWVPSTKRIKPQDSWQVALGVAKTFGTDYEVSLESYYKSMNNLLSYKEGASFLSFTDWQDKVEQGKGKSYGLEFFVQKKKGKTTGWIGYTLSWNTRQFENINSGREYPFKYDRRHDLSAVIAYSITDKISLSGTWIYGTGNSITLDESSYYAMTPTNFPFSNSGNEVGVPSSKNSYRMKAYHRLDVGISFKKKRKRWERTISFGAYNTYNNKNPYFIYYNPGDKKFRQVSLFPVIPYINYSFKF